MGTGGRHEVANTLSKFPADTATVIRIPMSLADVGGPIILSVGDSPDPANEGVTVEFSVQWLGINPAQAVICKTDSVSAASCPGGAWATGALASSTPVTATYTTSASDIGTQNYFAFACDSGGLCSSSMQGSFTVQNLAPSITSASDSPDPVDEGGTVSFSVGFTDPGAGSGQAVICKTDSASAASCPGGAWATGALASSTPVTATYTTSASDIGTQNYFAFACDSGGLCSSSMQGSFTVQNLAPSITSASDSPDPVDEGGTVSFSVGFTDPGAGSAQAVICKTDSVSAASCPGGAWATGALASSTPVTATYTTSASDIGTQNYFAFACDSGGLCSSSMQGSFTVQNLAPSITSASDSPDPVDEGGTVSFSVGFTDPGAGSAQAVICKTNSVSSGDCPGGGWATGAITNTSPATAIFIPGPTDIGTYPYFAFACDSGGLCSSSMQGSLTITLAANWTNTALVSKASNGDQGNADSGDARISSDGRYVAFTSYATNLVAGDTNGVSDVFVHDRYTGITARVSVSSSGAQANGHATGHSISADGRYVAFISYASNLVTGDTNAEHDVFVHDRLTGATTRVSVTSSGGQANDFSIRDADISADGRYVAFFSYASNLVSGDRNNTEDVFVHDRLTGVTERASVDSNEQEATDVGNDLSLSADGRYVMFLASGLPEFPNADDVFVRDRVAGTTSKISFPWNEFTVPPGSGDMSKDGQWIAWEANGGVTLKNRITGQAYRPVASSGGKINTSGGFRLTPSGELLSYVCGYLEGGYTPPQFDDCSSPNPGERKDDAMRIFDIATGQVTRRFATLIRPHPERKMMA